MSRTFLVVATTVVCAAGKANDAPPVEIADAIEQPIVRTVLVSGTVTSPQNALISPSVGGLVAEIEVDAGDRVQRGDVLMVLDAELEQLELVRLEAELSRASATLGDAQRRLEEAERVISASAISETELKSIRAQVESESASLAAADAAVRHRRAIVDRHRVTAPFAGVVAQRLVALGEWVNPGGGLVELVATEDLRFDFRVPQEYYDDIDMDTVVELRSDAVPDFAAEGRIQAIVPVKDAAARTFLLRVTTDESHSAVTPGMSAQGTLRVDTRRTGVVITRDALLQYPDGRRVVWIVDQTKEIPRVFERNVETGLMFDGLVEVRGGLDAGAAVVTRGNEALQEGQAVTIR